MCVIYAKDSKLVEKPGHTNVLVYTKRFVNSAAPNFLYFYFFNITMSFVKQFMTRLPFYTISLQNFSKVLTCQRVLASFNLLQ